MVGVMRVELRVASAVFTGVLGLILDWFMTCEVVTVTSPSTKGKG